MNNPQPVEPSLAATGETVEATHQAAADSGAPAAAPQPAEGRLQDILPEIKNLAHRVGGLDKLAEIVANLQRSKD